MQKSVGYWDGQILRAPVPPGRDPFINTPLLPLGKGADGEERFWISSWNSVSGTTGVLVTESGKERIYRFGPPHSGFYSAAQEDSDTLWLCGDLSRVVRLTLSSGTMEVYETGAPPALVFAGMTISHATGKLYAAAFPPSGPTAFLFDYQNRRSVRVYENICDERYMRAHFPNGDGTFSSVMHIPGLSLMQWDPQAEMLEKVVSHEDIPGLTLPVDAHLKVDRFISNAQGQWYFPEIGWYDPRTRRFSSDGPRPTEEMVWFARRGDMVWGLGGDNGQKVVGKWNLENGEVEKVCSVTDVHSSSAVLSANGKIVIVSIYGDFSRYDGDTGALEISRRLPTDSIAHTDCLRRIDETRLLGTPFITQRFWEVDLKTGRGFDCGRAAPGAGQITKTWKIGEKIYMAAYAGGELMEYDPATHPHFPENPRVVATSPHAMRPVAAADDGRNLYYSSNHHYGRLGCVVTKYDTATGLASYFDDPIPGQAIRSLRYDGSTHSLLAGTTMHADCNSAEPASSTCYFARFDADDFSLLEQHAAPQGAGLAAVHGALEPGRYLCEVSGTFDGEMRTRWFVASLSDFKVPGIEGMEPPPEKLRRIIATEKPGLFVLFIGDEIQLWDMRCRKLLTILCSQGAEFYNGFAEGDSLLLATTREVVVLENCLTDY
jgi:hypothetical protein